jgi:hypothetical protein
MNDDAEPLLSRFGRAATSVVAREPGAMEWAGEKNCSPNDAPRRLTRSETRRGGARVGSSSARNLKEIGFLLLPYCERNGGRESSLRMQGASRDPRIERRRHGEGCSSNGHQVAGRGFDHLEPSRSHTRLATSISRPSAAALNDGRAGLAGLRSSKRRPNVCFRSCRRIVGKPARTRALRQPLFNIRNSGLLVLTGTNDQPSTVDTLVRIGQMRVAP